MQLLFEALTYHRGADAPWSVVIILLVRVSLVLAAAFIVGQVLRSASAAVLHRVWGLALLGTLAVPALWALTPSWRLPLVTVQVAGGTTWPTSVVETDPNLASSLLVGGIWLTGTLVGLAILLLGVLQARRTLSDAARCEDPRWLLALALAKRELAFTGRVELRMSTLPISPAVWGFGRTRVLLPIGADHWSLAQRRSVMLHELAHVRRGDCFWNCLAAVVCAVWWFHPLAWLAAGRLRALGEQSADDCVLLARTPRETYAGHLLAIASWLRSSRLASFAPAMFRHSHLERRLAAILDSSRDRSPVGSGARSGGALAAAALVLLSILTPSRVVPGTLASSPPKAAPLPVAPEKQPEERSHAAEAQLELAIRWRLSNWDAAQTGDGLQPIDVPQEAEVNSPPTKVILIPNWEVGGSATQLIPNYRDGMSRNVLVGGDGSAQLAAMAPRPTATVPSIMTSVD